MPHSSPPMVRSLDHLSTHTTRFRIPMIDNCCGCVTDLKTAAAIIAVLGVVTSPAVSWAFVRHSYVVRVSCFVSASAVRADVVDVQFKNVLSFGFGANAGVGESCIGYVVRDNKSSQIITRMSREDQPGTANLVLAVQSVGWMLLGVDIIFILLSLHFLYSIFRPPAQFAAKRFIIACIVSVLLAFVHGMMYVAICIAVGGTFPIFEFVFCIIDVIVWAYFLVVINSYRRQLLGDHFQ